MTNIPVENQEKFKVLLIRFSSIGDIVLTTPILKSIKEKFPNVEVHFLTLNRYSSLIKYNPHIDNVLTLSRFMGIKETINLALALRKNRYKYKVRNRSDGRRQTRNSNRPCIFRNTNLSNKETLE